MYVLVTFFCLICFPVAIILNSVFGKLTEKLGRKVSGLRFC